MLACCEADNAVQNKKEPITVYVRYGTFSDVICAFALLPTTGQIWNFGFIYYRQSRDVAVHCDKYRTLCKWNNT